MNKKRVNDWILPAKKAIEDCGISEQGKVEKGFRSQISSFGAAAIMGSLKSAVAFFAEKDKSAVDRTKLIVAMYYIITDGNMAEPKEIFQYICDHDTFETKEKFIDASIAIKLALNFFDLSENDEVANEA